MAETRALRRALGFWDLVLFGLVFIAPVGAFTLFGFVNAFSGGAVVLPYVLGAVGLAFTGLSYAAMAEVAPQAGSSYGFARLALGNFAGFGAGWAILLDYVVIAALVVLYGALYLSPLASGVPVEALMIGSALFMLVALGAERHCPAGARARCRVASGRCYLVRRAPCDPSIEGASRTVIVRGRRGARRGWRVPLAGGCPACRRPS
jgi:hypothetical protein